MNRPDYGTQAKNSTNDENKDLMKYFSFLENGDTNKMFITAVDHDQELPRKGRQILQYSFI